MFGTGNYYPTIVSKDDHYVVDFHFIDDFRCIRPLREAVQDPHFDDLDTPAIRRKEEQLRSELSSLFRDTGWEGDGEINCIFVPPCFLDTHDGWCRVIYHVKQRNNGTSWLAIPHGMELSLPDGQLSKKRRG